jgi:hypothetical protein
MTYVVCDEAAKICPPFFRERFLVPILTALEGLDVGRACVALSDENWFIIGCLRVVSQETSGRSHLQRLCDLSIS